eukprot:scaffold22604_cov130-Cylindrotheca_fusiformis.AAC.6
MKPKSRCSPKTNDIRIVLRGPFYGLGWTDTAWGSRDVRSNHSLLDWHEGSSPGSRLGAVFSLEDLHHHPLIKTGAIGLLANID